MPPERYALIEDGESAPTLLPGGHLIALVDQQRQRPEERAVELRLAGFSFRDTILVLTVRGPILALLFRAPLAERNVPANVVTFGTGALYTGKSRHLERYPANVLLVHDARCSISCTPGCPVNRLDEISGWLKSGAKTASNRKRLDGDGWFLREGSTSYADEGGSSRFFKQFRSVEEAKAWLVSLISGPE
jgi:hypothetical protein